MEKGGIYVDEGDCPKPNEGSRTTNVCGVLRLHGYARKWRPCEFRFRVLPSPRHQHVRPEYAEPTTDRKSENHYHKPGGFECCHTPNFSPSAFRIIPLSMCLAADSDCGSSERNGYSATYANQHQVIDGFTKRGQRRWRNHGQHRFLLYGRPGRDRGCSRSFSATDPFLPQ